MASLRFRKKHVITALVFGAIAVAAAVFFLVQGPSGKSGAQVENVLLTDIDGNVSHLKDFSKGRRAVVIFGTSTTCPMSKHYLPILAAIEKQYGGKGVSFLFINSIATDPVADMKAALERNAIAAPYIHDKDGSLASILGLRTTTDLLVVGPDMQILYRGAVDDQLGVGHAREKPRHEYLKDALGQILKGVPVTLKETAPSGCILEVTGANSVSSRGITYHNRVADIIQRNCLECHRKGGVAPFPLEGYNDAVAHKGMMEYMVRHDRMPPWGLAATDNSIEWINNRALSPQEKEDLLDWLKSDLAEGDKVHAPLKKDFQKEWKFGNPDIILQMPEPIEIPATGVFPLRRVNIPNTAGKDIWLKSVEVLPTAVSSVHHILVWAVRRGTYKLFDPVDSQLLTVYVPGTSGVVYPDGMAKLLPPDWDIIMHVHYTASGTKQSDQTRVGFRLADKPPKHSVRNFVFMNRDIKIPPYAENHKEVLRTARAPFGMNLVSVLPHMHLRGKSAKVEIMEPDGKIRPILNIPRFDFNWQQAYLPVQPVRVRAGSRILYTGVFDNSARNPANPDPSAALSFLNSATFTSASFCSAVS